MNPVTVTAITDVVKTLATLVGICWIVGRVLKYWEARLPYFGPEPVPGIHGMSRREVVQRQTEESR